MRGPNGQARLRSGWLAALGPGLLVAATGVGAGDLATAGFAGMQLGPAILWAIVLGAFLKFVLTEGLARWQLATGQTILEGAVTRLGWPVRVGFPLYLLPWTFFVGAALISACGVTAAALVAPLGRFEEPATAKLVLGAAHSAVGLALVWWGGFRLFERVMAVAVGLMFVGVVATAVLLRPEVGAIARGLLVPTIPRADEGGLAWTIALVGGVGGTLTVICYGYWIREEGRTGEEDLRTCRLDLAAGYVATALFGLAMVIIARGGQVDTRGAGLIVALADRVETAVGPTGRWVFLVGAWAAVFSSLLGVWQAVPYVFADFVRLHRTPGGGIIDRRGLAYRGFLVALAVVPLLHVHHPFREVQKYYAIIGAAFIPILAVVLLLLAGRRAAIGVRRRNRPLTNAVLVAILVLAAGAGVLEIRQRWAARPPTPTVEPPAPAR